METGKTPVSEAKAIRLMGTALEEIEQKMLWNMGGQIGGFNPTTEIGTAGDGCLYGKVTVVFDMDRLEEYFNPNR